MGFSNLLYRLVEIQALFVQKLQYVVGYQIVLPVASTLEKDSRLVLQLSLTYINLSIELIAQPTYHHRYQAIRCAKVAL